jgi:hypothetical protein
MIVLVLHLLAYTSFFLRKDSERAAETKAPSHDTCTSDPPLPCTSLLACLLPRRAITKNASMFERVGELQSPPFWARTPPPATPLHPLPFTHAPTHARNEIPDANRKQKQKLEIKMQLPNIISFIFILILHIFVFIIVKIHRQFAFSILPFTCPPLPPPLHVYTASASTPPLPPQSSVAARSASVCRSLLAWGPRRQ